MEMETKKTTKIETKQPTDAQTYDSDMEIETKNPTVKIKQSVVAQTLESDIETENPKETVMNETSAPPILLSATADKTSVTQNFENEDLKSLGQITCQSDTANPFLALKEETDPPQKSSDTGPSAPDNEAQTKPDDKDQISRDFGCKTEFANSGTAYQPIFALSSYSHLL